MVLANQKAISDQDYYLPSLAEVVTEVPLHWTGERRTHENAKERWRIKWPKPDTKKKEIAARMAIFRDWHEIALCHAAFKKNGPAIAVLSVIWRYFNTSTGTAWAGNKSMAEVAGVSTKTISRGLRFLSDSGFVWLESRWVKRVGEKKAIEQRTIYFTFPKVFERPVFLGNLEMDCADDSGPLISDVHLDNSGLNTMDNSGPGIIKDTVEKGRTDAA